VVTTAWKSSVVEANAYCRFTDAAEHVLLYLQRSEVRPKPSNAAQGTKRMAPVRDSTLLVTTRTRL
jgi:hypothetical protein